ncbi:uncharacterized protein LOC102809111 [Saccoglossus kowalevskii]|uniref:Uncharacterized protein LOC102809111 n=1 Tax=Saccoglossus kowalevskii TaxID=10224 RepID=A0ABM0MUB0_SACKO|nr:PREDICTED: uncharacterized protein LOC102809111 [Saccoglossus kowalevskii]
MAATYIVVTALIIAVGCGFSDVEAGVISKGKEVPAKANIDDLKILKQDILKRTPSGEIEKSDVCAKVYPDFPYMCADFSWCLAETQICDGHVTCQDGSDENNCQESGGGDAKDTKAFYDARVCATMLPEYPYRCSRGGSLCLGAHQLCDGLAQCPNYNDEMGCDYSYGGSDKCRLPIDSRNLGNTGQRDLNSQLLDAHNYFRCLHRVGPLSWDASLANVARRVASDNMMRGYLKHSSYGYGENLAMVQISDISHISGYGIIKMWYDEIEMYDFSRQGFKSSTGHLTQVLWAGTTKLGCGAASKDGAIYIACEYDPPGNVIGRFEKNVFPRVQ